MQSVTQNPNFDFDCFFFFGYIMGSFNCLIFVITIIRINHYYAETVSVLLFRGFTKFSRADYVRLKAENRIVPDGVNAKVCLSLTN